MGPVSLFIRKQFRHFNAATLVDAADSYTEILNNGGKMVVAMAGAMSTAEIGIGLAEMIRQGKVHLISCTGANLEEDLFNLVAHNHYERIPDYRNLSIDQELELYQRGMNRVTDTCIPEQEAIRRVEGFLLQEWKRAQQDSERMFPHEYLWRLLSSGLLEGSYQIDPKNSWLLAALEHGVPIIVPGWEDSTLGNIFAAHLINGDIESAAIIKTGIEYMVFLAQWYEQQAETAPLGFLQIGGGIAGDFPICVVPLLHQDLGKSQIPLWGYYCQISDSTTSYGSYSGALPNEKISWGKLAKESPRFIIESDATIVTPLLFAMILGH